MGGMKNPEKSLHFTGEHTYGFGLRGGLKMDSQFELI